MTPRSTRSGKSGGTFLYLILTILLVVFIFWFVKSRFGSHPEGQDVTRRSTPATNQNGFPVVAQKQKPFAATFQECPPEGDGGDPALNLLKNRIDESAYIPVEFDIVKSLPWPESIERKKRRNWPQADGEEVFKYEGTPVAVEGYLLNVKEEGPESPNCRGNDHASHDYHVWLGKSADDDRSQSIVVEVTPPIHAQHDTWTLKSIRQLIRNKMRVKISGWLLLDPEHPDQVGKTRGTIWEIHPIMHIDVKTSDGWHTLDQLAADEDIQ